MISETYNECANMVCINELIKGDSYEGSTSYLVRVLGDKGDEYVL